MDKININTVIISEEEGSKFLIWSMKYYTQQSKWRSFSHRLNSTREYRSQSVICCFELFVKIFVLYTQLITIWALFIMKKAHPKVLLICLLLWLHIDKATMLSSLYVKAPSNWPYSGIRIRTSTSKNYTYENFDAIRIQRKISASFPVKMLYSKFISKEKSGGYSDYCYSRKESIERK